MSIERDEVERTQAPSPRWVAHAREVGSWPSSLELTTACTVLVGLLLIRMASGPVGQWFSSLPRESVGIELRLNGADPTAECGRWVWLPLCGTVLLLCIPATVAVAVGIGQVGMRFRPGLLIPNWERLSPGQAFHRLSPAGALWRSGIAVVKFSGLVALAVWWIWCGLTRPYEVNSVPAQVAHYAAAPLDLATKLAAALVAFGLVDYGRAWWVHLAQMGMTREELRAELRETEGDPTIRRRRRQLRFSRSQSNYAKVLLPGDVIVTGRGRLAIGLRMASDGTAVVIVRAVGTVAESLERSARVLGNTVIREDRLARVISVRADVGSRIPAELVQEISDRLSAQPVRM